MKSRPGKYALNCFCKHHMVFQLFQYFRTAFMPDPELEPESPMLKARQLTTAPTAPATLSNKVI